MCVLCGEPITRLHWSDQRDQQEMGGDDEGGRRRDRVLRLRTLRAVVGHYGLTVADFNARSLVVGDAKGNTTLVADLGELWPVAERLAHRRLDPLDPGLLEAL